MRKDKKLFFLKSESSKKNVFNLFIITASPSDKYIYNIIEEKYMNGKEELNKTII